MALVTPVANPSGNANANIVVPPISGDLEAGEALLAVAPCYIKASDGKVYMSNGTAANEAASFDGFTPCAYASGEVGVTLMGVGAQFGYSTGMTPGKLYIGTTAGRLDTAATTGDAVGVAKAINAHMIRVTRSA